jgi:hypothetical protein
VVGAAHGENVQQEFSIEIATEKAEDPAFCVLWSALVAESCGSEKIYQTPAYFQFQREVLTVHRMELLTITRRRDAKLVGVVPVRIGAQTIDFSVGGLSLCKTDVITIRLLGSTPVAPGGAAMAQYLVQMLLSLFPEAKAVFMHALPRASELWGALATPGVGGRSLVPGKVQRQEALQP